MQIDIRSVAAWPIRKFRRLRTQLLHPLRHTRALADLRSVTELERVLFVCLGNICRSPYAEAVFNQMVDLETDSKLRAYSAGFVGPGRATPEEGQAVAISRGIDLSSHRSQLITDQLVSEVDLVIVMQPDQQRAVRQRFNCNGKNVVVLGDLDLENVDRREIKDPFDQSEAVFEASFDRIERCVRVLLKTLTEGGLAKA